MAKDQTLALRRAVVSRLRTDLAALVGARTFGEQPPTLPAFPFVRYGESDTLPFLTSCSDGCRVAFPVHAFSKGPFTDQCHAISAAAAQSLDGAVLTLASGDKAAIVWKGSQILRDGDDAANWHGVSRFEATIA